MGAQNLGRTCDHSFHLAGTELGGTESEMHHFEGSPAVTRNSHPATSATASRLPDHPRLRRRKQ